MSAAIPFEDDPFAMHNGIAPSGCTCTMTRAPKGWESYNGPEPAEWEQNPWCPVHPDPANQTPAPPRFIPFEAMTAAQQREHLRDWHRCPIVARHDIEGRVECHDERSEMADEAMAPHTHDKPARRDT